MWTRFNKKKTAIESYILSNNDHFDSLKKKNIYWFIFSDFGTEPNHYITQQFGSRNRGARHSTLQEDCPDTTQPTDSYHQGNCDSFMYEIAAAAPLAS